MSLWLGSAAIFGVMLAGAGAGNVDPQATPEIAGSWKFNELRSDKMAGKVPFMDLPANRQGPPPGPPSGGGQPAAGGMPPGGRGNRYGGVIDPRLAMEFMRPVQQLTIALTKGDATITDENGASLTLPTNDKKVKQDVAAGLAIEFKAKWKDGDLRIEKRIGSNGTLRYVYRFDPVTKRLTVLVKFEGGPMGEPVEVRRVYDRVPTG